MMTEQKCSKSLDRPRTDRENETQANKRGRLVFDLLGNVLQWVKEAKEADADAMRRQMEPLAIRITSDGIVTLLRSANPPVDLDKALKGILLPCVGVRPSKEEKQKFLDEIIQPLCKDRPEMAVEVLELLAKSDKEAEFPEPHLRNLPGLWPLMFRAMRQPECTKEFFDSVQAHVIETDHSFMLPFESSATLCSMYINMCQDELNHDSVKLQRHEVLLPSALSRTAVFKNLVQRLEDVKGNESLLALLYFTWWAEPIVSLPQVSAAEDW
jgi:hypothetical protein